MRLPFRLMVIIGPLFGPSQIYTYALLLMAHWKKVIQIPMLEVRYEDLVNEPERISRAMIEFCGLDWDERCLRFHENKRVVNTPSYDQVRQPLYRKSVERWRNYEKHIGELIEALGPDAAG